jgi:hypothetical protein
MLSSVGVDISLVSLTQKEGLPPREEDHEFDGHELLKGPERQTAEQHTTA